MSISKAWYVSCTDCGHPADVTTTDAKEAVQIAYREGFIRVRRDGVLTDLCPDCSMAWEGPVIKPPRRRQVGTRIALVDVPFRATPTETKETQR